MNLVFDSYSLLALFRNERGAEAVLTRLRQLTVEKDRQGYLSTVNLGEIYGAMLRTKNERAATLMLEDLLTFPLRMVDADYDLCLEAARLKAKYPLTVGDAYAAALSLQQDALLITASADLAALPESVGLTLEQI